MKRRIIGIFVCMLLIASVVPMVEAANWIQTQKLLAPDGTTGIFDHSVSLSTSLKINQCMQKEKVSYSNKGQNLSMLEPGDIAFKRPDWSPYFLNHCLLYIGYNDSTGLYVFIEASGVGSNRFRYRYDNESTLTIGSFYGPFAKVRHANNTQKQNAIDFAKRQLGKPFQRDWINKNNNPEDTANDSLADEWYCSELVWAAYYNCNNPFPEEEPEDGYVYGEGIDLR